MTFLRILYVDSDIKRQELVKAAIRKEHPEHDVFVSPSLPLAKSKFDYEGPFDWVIVASSVDEPRSGDGLLFAHSLHLSNQKVVTLTPGDKGIKGIPRVSFNSPTMLEELVALLK